MKLGFPHVICCLVGLCSLALPPLAAQVALDYEREPQGLEQDFLLRVWETADGLLPTNVRSITQTHDGYVWLAAIDGFVRFDGARATVVSGKNTPGLPVLPKALRVHSDARSRLWGATSEGRLFSCDQQIWREYGPADGWPGLVVEAIAENTAGRLIFSGAKIVLELTGSRFSPVTLPAFPKDFRPPLKAIFDPEGKLWLTSPSHVWCEEAAGWKLVVAAAIPGSLIQGAAPAREAGMWIATAGALQKFVGSAPVVTYERPEGFRNDNLELLEDFHGNLWAGGANSGLRIWMADGRKVIASTSAETLPAQITCLFEDRERNVLVGTAGAGVARFKPRPFAVWFGRLGGLAGTIVNTICEEAPGRILIGTEGSGLRRISRDRPPTLLVSDDGALGPKHRVSSLLRCRDGTVLAAVSGRGLFRVEGDRAVAITAEPLAGEHVRVMFEDSRGRLWIGHEKGLTVRENGRFARWPAGDTLGLMGVRAIAEDREGVLWFIGKEGVLARLAGDKLEKATVPALRGSPNLLGLYADRDGTLWIGVESQGLLRLKHGQAFLYTADHGLPVVSPGAFVEEGENLWLSGEKGLVRLPRASLDAVAAGRASRLELQLFNRADGLPSDACRRGYQPAACVASDGQLWFATHKGAVSVRPAEILTAAYEPPAIIEEVRAEMQLILVTPANREHLEIPAGTRHMSIRCAIPSLGKPEYARFQYRLEGFDNLWHDAGAERVIRFYDLQPGSYRFHVRAIGTDGRFVETPASVAMTVHPRYWQTLWFRSLCVAGLVAAVAFLVWRSQQRRLRGQEARLRNQEARAALEAQLQQAQKMEAIGRLAGGIAHDFNNLLTGVSGNAELLQMELDPQTSAHGIAGDIATAAGRARDLVGQILTFSRQRAVERHALDPAPVLRESWHLLRSGISPMIELRAEVPETLPAILADAAQLQRIVMNLGTNAAQAVGSVRGHILMRSEECAVTQPGAVPPGHYVRLTVEDNGRGMDEQTLQRIFDPFFTTNEVGHGTGLGLSVVHGIVEAHDGFITVQSRPQAGTTFQLYFPITTQSVAAPPAAAQPLSPPSSERGRILLVDDESVVLKVTESMLARLGYEVHAFTDPAAVLDAFAAAPDRYRLLLTDFAMPQFDGVELARRVWSVRPGFPIILYSGYGGRLTPEEAVKMGFVQLLHKPFQMHALAEAITAALRAAPSGGSGPVSVRAERP
ncbi:MAG: two-component system, cell cycle sensor histidine kinase and response regulator CckA [Chthoniobacter sp.]|nr:two-component system, cell cycle sensor histidine kinase and response regulator CckA [Chthoniobacter sp.]